MPIENLEIYSYDLSFWEFKRIYQESIEEILNDKSHYALNKGNKSRLIKKGDEYMQRYEDINEFLSVCRDDSAILEYKTFTSVEFDFDGYGCITKGIGSIKLITEDPLSRIIFNKISKKLGKKLEKQYC